MSATLPAVAVGSALVVFVLFNHDGLRVFTAVSFEPDEYAVDDCYKMAHRFIQTRTICYQSALHRVRRHGMQPCNEDRKWSCFEGCFNTFSRFITRTNEFIKIHIIRIGIRGEYTAHEIQNANAAVNQLNSDAFRLLTTM